MKLINKTPRKHVEEGYIEVLSDSASSVVISSNYKGKLVKLTNNNVTASFDNTKLKVNDHGTLDYRGVGSFTLFNDPNLTYITVNNNPIALTNENSLVHWIKTGDLEYRIFIEPDIESKRDKNSPFNVTDDNGNDQSSINLDSTYPVSEYGLNIFRYSDEGIGTEYLYFRVTEGNWIRFPSYNTTESQYAKKTGDNTQIFKSADGVDPDDVVTKGQLDTKQDNLVLDDSLYFTEEGKLSSNITGAEIKIKYEGENNTNAYTDAEKAKLGAIDATHYMSPVQSTTDLTAIPEASITDKARTFVENEISDYFYDETAVSGDLSPNDQTGGTGFWRKVISSGETPASIKTKYESNGDTNAFTTTEKNKLAGIEFNATADQTPEEIKAAYEFNADTEAFTTSEKGKLGGIESGATADQTGAEIKSLYELELDTNAFTDALKSKLDSITAIFTTALKTAYDNTVTWITTNGTTLLNHLSNTSNPHSVDKNDVGLNLVPNLDTTAAVTNQHTHTNKPILDNIENLLNETAKLNAANTFTQQQIIEGTLSIPVVLSSSTHKAWVFHRPGGVGNEAALIFAPNLAVGSYVDGNNVDWAKQVKFDDGGVEAIGFRTTTPATGFLKADGSVDPTTYTDSAEVTSIANSVAVQVVEANTGVIDVIGFNASTVLTGSLRGYVTSIDSATNVSITVNQNSLGNVGDVAYIDQTGLGEITIVAGTGTVNLRKNSSVQLITDGQYSRVAIHKVSATDYRVFGELKPL